MKEGSLYAGRLKKAFSKLRASVDAPSIPEPRDPIECLVVSIFGVSGNEEGADRAADKLLSTMADWNEIRVAQPVELHQIIGTTVSDSLERCRRLVSVLRALYVRENRISLDHLKASGRRDARHYLETLDGMDEYAVASIVLWSLGGHAIPISDRVLKGLREADLVHPEATRTEVQAFLERHIGAADAKEFALLIRSVGTLKRAGGGRAETKSSSKGH